MSIYEWDYEYDFEEDGYSLLYKGYPLVVGLTEEQVLSHIRERYKEWMMILEKLRELLAASTKVPMEDPGIFIFDTCINWKRTVPVLPRNEKEMDDVDTEAEDHPYDDTRYRIMDRRLVAVQSQVMGF